MRSRVEIDDEKYCTVENNNLCNNFKLHSYEQSTHNETSESKIINYTSSFNFWFSDITKINVKESNTHTHIS